RVPSCECRASRRAEPHFVAGSPFRTAQADRSLPATRAAGVRYFIMLAVKKLATYADLVALPPHLVGEIIDGELIASPRPASPHVRAASRLGIDLGPVGDATGGP